MSKSFYETESEPRWWFGIFGRVVLAIVLLGAISIGLYLFGVFSSGVKGRLDQRVKQNEVGNRIFQQQHFEDLKAQYDADLAKIPLYKKEATDPTSQTNLLGVVSNCVETATTYNQDSQKVLATDSGGTQFKTADLPETLSTTECNQ